VRRLTRIAAGRSKTASKEVEVPLETFHEARIAAAPGLDEAPVGGHGRSAWSMLDRWPAARGGRSCARRAGWYRAGCGPGRWPEQRGSDASGKASATAAAMPSAPSAATSTTPSHRGSDRDRSASTGARPRPRWTQRGPGVSRAITTTGHEPPPVDLRRSAIQSDLAFHWAYSWGAGTHKLYARLLRPGS